METRKFFIASSGIMAAVFVLFVFFYWDYVNDAEQKRVDNHSQVIANAIWDFEIGGMMEYMRLASEAYKYKHVLVTQSTGEVVIELEHSFQNPIDKLFASMKLLPARVISSNVIYDGKVIGRIRVVWQNTAIYIYFYILILTVLMITGLGYYLRTINAKHELEERVVERTANLQKEIQDRIHAEKALRISHERFLAVLNSLDATIYVADLETYEILFINKYMIESFGKDMTGETCWKVFRTEGKPCSHCNNTKLVDENGEPTGVHVWQDKNPITEKWYINYDRAIEWTDGRLVKLQIATDITDFKKMEEELRQAHKMESIGTLAGGIAHDFNNILSIIIGNTELALDDIPEGNPPYKNIKEIKIASLRAKDIVKQLLSFSRKMEQEQEPIDIANVVKESLNLIKSSIPSSIEIRDNIPESCDIILADATQIHQVLINLCTNAAHSMGEDGGILEVSLRKNVIEENSKDIFKNLAPGNYLELTVTDTGSGIEIEACEKIFDPYFTTKEVGKGTGMGLAVVHGIVKNSKGEIYVNSVPGKGSTFTILFPITAKQPEQVTRLSAVKSNPTGKETILFVDDEQALVDMARMMLEKLGYRVQICNNPVKALALFEANPDRFDLVISDMTMPQMSGVKLSKELKEIRHDIPIIICTGHSSLIDEEKIKDIGISAFALKPITMSEIAKLIRDVLDK